MADQFKVSEIQRCSCGKYPGFRDGMTRLKKVKRLECECGKTTKWFDVDDVFPGYEDDCVADIDLINAWNLGEYYYQCEKCGHYTRS